MANTSNIQGPWEVGTNNVPRYPGVYVVFAMVGLGKPQVLYIGESNNIASRMVGHERREDWEREARGRPLMFYAMHIESIFERLQLEQELIRHFSPPCNVKFTSNALPSGIRLGAMPPATPSNGGPLSGTSGLARIVRKNKTKSRTPAYGLGAFSSGGIRLGAMPPATPSNGGPLSGTSALARIVRKNKTKSRTPAYGLGAFSSGGIRLGAMPPATPSNGGPLSGTSALARIVRKNKTKSRTPAYGLGAFSSGGIRLGAMPPATPSNGGPLSGTSALARIVRKNRAMS